jgi:hypothetical protein
MPLDEIFMRLAKREFLGSRAGRGSTLSAVEASVLADKDGFVKGRDKSGKLIKGRIAGKSKARQLREAAEAAAKAAVGANTGRRRRKGNKRRGTGNP